MQKISWYIDIGYLKFLIVLLLNAALKTFSFAALGDNVSVELAVERLSLLILTFIAMRKQTSVEIT